MTIPETALETLQGARVQTPAVDTVLDIDTTFDPITLDDRLTTVSPDVLGRIGREQRIDDADTFRQTVPDAAEYLVVDKFKPHQLIKELIQS